MIHNPWAMQSDTKSSKHDSWIVLYNNCENIPKSHEFDQLASKRRSIVALNIMLIFNLLPLRLNNVCNLEFGKYWIADFLSSFVRPVTRELIDFHLACCEMHR